MKIEDFAGGREPTQNEQWVACTMQNNALAALCVELVVQFSGYVPPTWDRPGPTAIEIIEGLLAGVAMKPLENGTDLEPPADFDEDVAKRVALESIEQDLEMIFRLARGG